MSDLKRTVQDEKGAKYAGGETPGQEGRRRAHGKDDVDDSGRAKNLGHGHPREERKRSAKRGESDRVLTDEDRRQRDLGGPA